MPTGGHRRVPILLAPLFVLAMLDANMCKAAETSVNRTGTQWSPFIEWSLKNPTYAGNPFDLLATATFAHKETGEKRVTEMFYHGNNIWKFRFTATRPGKWTFTTASSDSDLDGKKGMLSVKPNPKGIGFVTGSGNKWCRQVGIDGSLEAFVPQFVMYDNPSVYHQRPDIIDADIKTFMVEHGFDGFHTVVCCRWFDINQERSTGINDKDPNPDPRTFEALELLITKVHAARGVVHIWAWGDESRRQTPIKWSINGKADRRLQRYIAARLGPIPGWTMGYGYDLWEWVKGEELSSWHEFMHKHLGWRHMLGARSWTNSLKQLSEAMDYSSYEQHRPDYEKHVETIEKRPDKPSFSEDRFRIRGRGKDYTMQETRRGLWHATMAGGVANIWGNLKTGRRPGGGSLIYPRPEWIKTYSVFFKNRFLIDMPRDNSITDGVCLKRPDNMHYVFYKEDATSIEMELSKMKGAQPAVAVDTSKPYGEIDLGKLTPKKHTWRTPYKSDWAIAVDDFSEAVQGSTR